MRDSSMSIRRPGVAITISTPRRRSLREQGRAERARTQGSGASGPGAGAGMGEQGRPAAGRQGLSDAAAEWQRAPGAGTHEAWGPLGAPPYTQVDLMREDAPNLTTSFWICGTQRRGGGRGSRGTQGKRAIVRAQQHGRAAGREGEGEVPAQRTLAPAEPVTEGERVLPMRAARRSERSKGNSAARRTRLHRQLARGRQAQHNGPVAGRCSRGNRERR